ncbi:MAG: carboxypeptidase-like regulatory domain-containing protein, partial [Prolixibacteraceae bacterium]|nr:carboxypeptidase-like regulatory domain-containing protein [Prolixibacteraceae bacterium]
MKYNYLYHNIARYCFTCILFILFIPGTFASKTGLQSDAQQNITVTGTVTSAADGVALPGLSVLQKGTNNGTITNADGNYSINVPRDAILVFSFVGFRPLEVEVQGRNTIDVVM